MPAVVFFAHGSSVESANQAVRLVAAEAAAQAGIEHYDVAFLEQAAPTLGEAVERQVAAGAARVLIVPYFLTLGIHLQRDLPLMVKRLRERHPALEVEVTAPLDGHSALSGILADRTLQAIDAWESSKAKRP